MKIGAVVRIELEHARWILDVCEGFLMAAQVNKRTLSNQAEVETAIKTLRERVNEARARDAAEAGKAR